MYNIHLKKQSFIKAHKAVGLYCFTVIKRFHVSMNRCSDTFKCTRISRTGIRKLNVITFIYE